MEPARASRISTGTGFPRSARLTRPAEFERALRRPDIRLRAGPLRIAAIENTMLTARLGLIIGKKAVARAHARNRLKRIIRDRFRQERHRLAAMDIVVRVVAPVPASGLHDALSAIFESLESRTGERPEDT